jgi:hypothetical protein
MAVRGTAARPTIRPEGVWLVLVGVGLVVASFVKLNWYLSEGGADSVGDRGFHALRHTVDTLGGTPIAGAYFDWLGWALLAGVLVIGIFANLPGPISDVLRVVGFLIGLAGSAATFYGLEQLLHAEGSSSSVWHNSSYGLWTALGGYLIAAVGASLGPRGASATIGA